MVSCGPARVAQAFQDPTNTELSRTRGRQTWSRPNWAAGLKKNFLDLNRIQSLTCQSPNTQNMIWIYSAKKTEGTYSQETPDPARAQTSESSVGDRRVFTSTLQGGRANVSFLFFF